jgi:serine/threonine-protein kinase
LLGQELGRYRIRSELGSGGMGTVYLAEDRDGQAVAVKVIHPHLVATSGFFQRFLREAELGKRVRHENVVRTLDVAVATVDGRPVHFMVLECVEGRPLREVLNDLGTVPETLLRELALQMAAGLAAIHDAGIVHRDLKPENVLVTPDHRVRIMDLGVAKLQEASVVLTREGHFAGTFLYAAPEQFQGEVGPSADLYSLGVVLHELATGRNPFRHDDPGAVIQAQLTLVPPRLCEVDSRISRFFADVVATLLRKDPQERFSSAAELRRVLERGEEASWWAERETQLGRSAAVGPLIPVARETALHGRDRELAALDEAWERAKSGQGCVVVLEGEAGIGKTRLVDSFIRKVAGESAHVLYGAYPPSGGLGGYSESLVSQFGAAGLAEALRPYVTGMPNLVPAFAAVVKHVAAPTHVEPIQVEALHAVACHLMGALAAEKTTLWVIEDLHFAPSESRQLLLALARAAARYRVLLLLTSRPGVPEDELQHFSRLEHLRRLALRRLGAREVIEVLREVFRSDALAERLGGKIAYKSDGVPFFIFEMLRSLKEGGFLEVRSDGTMVQTQPITDIEVPSAVRDLIEARLGQLTDVDRSLLDLAAVHGFEFDADLLARVRGERRVQVLERLAACERRVGVVRTAGRYYRFDHNQIHEVIRSGLAPALREEYHTLLAEAYLRQRGLDEDAGGEDAFFLARHFLHGAEPRRGQPFLERAIVHLERSTRHDGVLELAERALSVAGLLEGGDRVDVLLRKGRRLNILGRTDKARAVLEEAVGCADELGDAALGSRARYELAGLCYFTSRYEEARPLAERALALAVQAGDRRLEMLACRGLGATLYGLSENAASRRFHQRSLALAHELGDRGAEGSALQNLGAIAVRLGEIATARDLMGKAVKAATAPASRAVASYSLALLEGYLGRHDESRRLNEEALALSREAGFRHQEGLCLQARAHDALRTQDWTAAERIYEQALALFQAINAPMVNAWLLNQLGYVRLEQGRRDEARRNLEAAHVAAREADAHQYVILSLTQLARFEPDRAAEARRAIEASAPQLGLLDLLHGWHSLWRSTGEQSDLEQAWRLLEHARRHAPEECRESMIENVPAHAEIVRAWERGGAKT